MSEDFICDITREAITSLLKRFPRKKGAYEELCKQYDILDMDELTEDLATEILEILDSASYVRARRDKEAYRIRLNHKLLIEAIDDFLLRNKENYLLLDKVQDCYLICKKIHIHVQKKNENNVFQPFETITEKEYFINFLVKVAEDYKPSDMISQFLTRGCKMIKVTSADSIDRVLFSVT